MFGRSAVLEKTQIDECLETKKAVGDYRYGVREFECELAGEARYQSIIAQLRNRVTPCEIVRESSNAFDKRAIAVLVRGEIVGHVPAACLDYMHKVFDAMGDERIRLVGTLMVGVGHSRSRDLMATAKIRVCRFSK